MPQGRCLFPCHFVPWSLFFPFIFSYLKYWTFVGDQLRRLEEKGVVIRFVIGRRYGLLLSWR
jgi:hypothetical protein